MDTIRSKEAWISGTVIATTTIVVLVAGLAASVWFNLDRSRLMGRVDVLQSELEKSQSRIEELQNTANADRMAREQAEEAADEARTVAAESRQRLQSQQQKTQDQIQALQASIQGLEQRLAAANEARTQVETELSNQIELRKQAEQRFADVTSELQREKELVRQQPGRADNSAEKKEPVSRRPSPSSTSVEEKEVAGSRTAVERTESEPIPSATESDAAEPEPQTQIAATPSPEPTPDDAAPTTTAASTGATYDTPPKPLALAPPNYPLALKRQGIEGHVVVAFTVDTRGRVRDVEVRESTNRAFESAAVNAVRQWRFRPAVRSGEPVELRISQRLNFSSN